MGPFTFVWVWVAQDVPVLAAAAAIIVYAILRSREATATPTWVKPFVGGVPGTLFDFSMDSAATMQSFSGREDVIGRWSWFIGPNDAHIFTDLCTTTPVGSSSAGGAARFLLLGRYWHRRNGRNVGGGYVYPILAMIAALLALASPISQFLFWLAPFFTKGSNAE